MCSNASTHFLRNLQYQEIYPEEHKAIKFDDHVLVVLSKGTGVFQVDFKNYSYSSGVGFFLSPGQYFKLLNGGFKIKIYTFTGELINQYRDSRFLFKHLVSLGHINLSDTKGFGHSDIQAIQIKEDDHSLLDVSVQSWLSLNPFRASLHELNLLFDIKEYVDNNYQHLPSVVEVAKDLGESVYLVKGLTKKKLETTVHHISQQKRLLEAKRRVAFTNLTTKEISFELGFEYTSHFNKFFKSSTTLTPREFRTTFDFKTEDQDVLEFTYLLDTYYKEERFLTFYADKLSMTEKTLSRKIKACLGVGFHEIMRNQILKEAETLLLDKTSVKDIAYSLGFKESNHFSSFFKRYKGASPLTFLTAQMYTL